MKALQGWLVIDKPVGIGSTQVVSAVKRALRAGGYAQVKVGHGGTLDPLASGVLPIALGEATKLAGRMLDARKAYDFELTFGTETAGLDAEGEVVAESDVRPMLAEIEAVLPRFTGPIEQVPPAFSAIRIDGQRAYDRARKGEAVEMKARSVTIHSLSVCRDDEDGEGRLESLTLTAHVSKGTYIRSLARDIARAVGSVGHVTMLRRTKAGPFDLSQAISLDKLNAFGQGAAQSDIFLPLEAGLVDIPALDLSPEAAGAIRQGRVWTGGSTQDGLYWGRDADNRPVALIEALAGTLKVVRGFNI